VAVAFAVTVDADPNLNLPLELGPEPGRWADRWSGLQRCPRPDRDSEEGTSSRNDEYRPSYLQMAYRL